MKKNLTIYVLAFIIISAFFLRIANAPYLVDRQEEEIIFTDNDAPYHALRIVEFAKSVTNKIQYHDPRSYHPEGHIPHWSPGFDFVLGQLGRIFYMIHPDDFALKLFISLLIPALGSLTLIFYYLLSRSFMKRSASLVATALFALLPFHITGTYFSVIDHHSTEYLFIILLYLTLSKLKNDSGPILFALVVVAGYWIVPGFLVDYIVLTAASVFVLIVCRLWDDYAWFAKKLFVAQLLSFAILLPTLFFSYYGSLLSMRFDSISLFQGVMTFIGMVITGLFFLADYFNKKSFKPIYLIIILISIVLITAFSVPEFYKQLINGLFHMKGSSHLRLASEFNVLGWDRLTAGYLKSFWPFFPLGIALVCFEAFKKRDFLLCSLIVPLVFYGLMAFVEVKFFRYFLIFGIIAGIFCCLKLYEVTSRRQNFQYPLIAIFLCLVFYGFSDYKKVFLLFKNAKNDAAYEALSFISKNYSQGKDGTSIFASWDLGHKIIYYTNFYNVDNPFLVVEKISHTKDVALFNFSREEKSALSILQKYDSRIVIMDSSLQQYHTMAPIINEQPSRYVSETGAFTSYFVGTLNGRLYFFDGTYMKDNSSEKRDIPAITSLRLVYETEKKIKTGGLWRPAYKVYEKVPGANITGIIEKANNSSDNQFAELSTTIMTNTGRKFLYVSRAMLNEDQSFSIKTPYAAPGDNGLVKALAPYTLSYGGQSIKIIVKEDDIRLGRAVTIDD